MSHVPCDEPGESPVPCPQSIQMVIVPRVGDIGGFEVQRALPFRKRKMVGPFIFWDQMGPGTFGAGVGLDVRPHPHIGLSTVTYLFDGTMAHKDSLGNDVVISPGEVNLMTAGRGIVHSERSDDASRAAESRLFGIQSWMALPEDKQEVEPDFAHYDTAQIPVMEGEGIKATVIMGEAFGVQSPVQSHMDAAYAELFLEAAATVQLPVAVEERAIYVVSGHVEIDGITFDPARLVLLQPGAEIVIKAREPAHIMMLGGASHDGPRYVWWNFVSSSKDRIRQAADDWDNERFPIVPGDDQERIPLPDRKLLEATKAGR